MTTVLDAEETVPGAARRRPRRSRRTARRGRGPAALAAWALVIVVGRLWGLAMLDAGRNILLNTPPLFGDARTGFPVALVPVAALAAGLVAGLPAAIDRLGWPAALATATGAAALWWLPLAAVDGTDGFIKGLEWESEWAPHMVAAAADPLTFLRTYVTDLL